MTAAVHSSLLFSPTGQSLVPESADQTQAAAARGWGRREQVREQTGRGRRSCSRARGGGARRGERSRDALAPHDTPQLRLPPSHFSAACQESPHTLATRTPDAEPAKRSATLMCVTVLCPSASRYAPWRMLTVLQRSLIPFLWSRKGLWILYFLFFSYPFFLTFSFIFFLSSSFSFFIFFLVLFSFFSVYSSFFLRFSISRLVIPIVLIFTFRSSLRFYSTLSDFSTYSYTTFSSSSSCSFTFVSLHFAWPSTMRVYPVRYFPVVVRGRNALP